MSFGNALQTSPDAIYGARHVALKAGCAIETPALTVNRLCGSGLDAVAMAARVIRGSRTLQVREREILGLLANGWSNRRIAEECFLSLNTVRTHVQNVLVKLGVHSKLEAAALAVRQGLVSIEDPTA